MSKEENFKKDIPKPVETLSAGILKKKEENDLEDRILESLRKIGSHMTKREIIALSKRIEVSKGLDGLRKELEKEFERSSDGMKDISEETLKEVLDLFREAKEAAELGLKELKLDIRKLNPSIDWELEANAHFSKRFPWIKRLEESELGKNIVIDLEGFLVGSIDSAVTIAKILFALIKDLALLPYDIYQNVRKK